eukprot:m.570 g.570  ORF g.570 m.570 type:complete len:61 (-) comp359_c0_seq1:12-194(-)
MQQRAMTRVNKQFSLTVSAVTVTVHPKRSKTDNSTTNMPETISTTEEEVISDQVLKGLAF